MSKALEAAAEYVAREQEPACVPCWHAAPGVTCGCKEDARAIILAFLDAAAGQQAVRWVVAEAFVEAEVPLGDTGATILDGAGKAAILALKEAVNAG